MWIIRSLPLSLQERTTLTEALTYMEMRTSAIKTARAEARAKQIRELRVKLCLHMEKTDDVAAV